LSQESREPCFKSQDSHLEEVSTATQGRSQTYKFLSKFKGSRSTRRYRVTVLTVSNNDFRLLRQSHLVT